MAGASPAVEGVGSGRAVMSSGPIMTCEVTTKKTHSYFLFAIAAAAECIIVATTTAVKSERLFPRDCGCLDQQVRTRSVGAEL